MMNRPTRNMAFWYCAAVFAVYIALVGLFGSERAKLIADAATLFVAVVITWSWAPAAWRAWHEGGLAGAALVLSLWLAWATLFVQRVWVIVRPADLANSPLNGLVAVLIFIAGSYAIAAPLTAEDDARPEVIHLIFAAAVGGVVLGAAATILVLRGGA